VFGFGARLGTTFGTTPYGMYITSITIQHLLQHTAGGWTNDGMDPMFRQPALSANDLISWTLDNRPLANPPGTNFAYSNFGYCILGRVIEAVTGQSYENWVRDNILGPSGVTDMRIAGDTGPERQWPEATYWGKDTDNPYHMRVRTCQAAPAEPSSVIKRRGPAARARLRRMSGPDGGLSFSWGAAVRAAPSRSRLSQIDPKFARNQKPILGIE
jgi:CubicO group peptidase (beta-lactamase class C family)